MKIHEIITEAPASRLGQLGRRVGAAALNAIGARGFAGELSGTADAKAWANRYYDEFSKFLGRTGGKLDTATTQDLRDFFKMSNLPDDQIPDVDGPVDQQTINKVLQQTANDYFRGRSSGKAKPSNTAQTAQPSNTDQDAAQPTTASTPANTRQQKQQAAAAAAQKQMAANPAPKQSNTSSLEKDKIYVGSDGKSYKWVGAQWQDMETGKSVAANATFLSDPQPESPEQKRVRLQKKAAKTIAKTAKAVKTAPKTATPPVAV